jgi:hypothetical protein
VDIEQLWIRLAEAGVTAMLKIDHERLEERGRSWTFLVSGPSLGDAGFVRVEESSLDRSIEVGLTRLMNKGDQWSWLSEYLPKNRQGRKGSLTDVITTPEW